MIPSTRFTTHSTGSKIAGLVTGAALLMLASAPAYSQEDPVVAKVGDRTITTADLDQALTEMGQQYQNFPEAERRSRVLDSLIDFNTLAILAEEAGMADEAEMKRRLALLRTRTLHNSYFLNNVQPKVTEEILKQRFEEEIGKITPEKQLKARHILVKTDEEARAIIKELQGGADFSELAKAKSTGPSGSKGGDLGTFGKGQMVPEFEAAAYGLEKGDYSKEPVKTQFGFHVILVEDKIDQPLPTFEEAREQLRQLMLTEAYADAVKGGRDKVGIEILEESLKLPELQ